MGIWSDSYGDFVRLNEEELLCYSKVTLSIILMMGLSSSIQKVRRIIRCSELTAFVSVNTPITAVMWDSDMKRYIPYSYSINLYEDYMRNCAPFDSVEYLLSYYGAKFSMLPPASVMHCKSQADCDELIDSLKGIICG